MNQHLKFSRSYLRKIGKPSIFIIAVTALFVIAMVASPTKSISPNQCSSYHGFNYNQQLDLLEGNSQNRIPTILQVGQTATVSVVLSNVNNAQRYTQLYSVSATLESLSNHFSVSQPTHNIGNLGSGTATATWQITGISAGIDQLKISASARNSHPENEGISPYILSDTYSPNPTITITNDPVPTPTESPTQNPTPPPPSPTQQTTITPIPTSNTNPTNPPTNPSNTPNPTTSTNPNPTILPTNATTPTISPTVPANQSEESNEFSSNMIYVHPPLAITGYIFIFIFTIALQFGKLSTKTTKIVGLGAWLLTALGLFSGMIWAQVAIGSYWTWDPKEIFTLALFLTLSGGQVAYFERKTKTAKILLIASCILVLATILSSIVVNSFA